MPTEAAHRVIAELARAPGFTLTGKAISRRLLKVSRLRGPMLELLNDMVKAGVLTDDFFDAKRVRGSISYTLAPSYRPAEAEGLTGIDRKRVRGMIDRATTKSDAHPTFSAMVAADSREAERPTMIGEISYVLGQIPPVVITCKGCRPITYRVLGERTLDAGTKHERRQIPLVCVTRTSMLHEHARPCSCRVCESEAIESYFAAEETRSVWYHDFTRTFHARQPDGTFVQISEIK